MALISVAQCPDFSIHLVCGATFQSFLELYLKFRMSFFTKAVRRAKFKFDLKVVALCTSKYAVLK